MVHDDWVMQRVVGNWATGRWTALEAGFVDYTNQTSFLWLFLYAGELRLFGVDPVPWHLTTNVLHALSAALLFVLIAGCLNNRAAAASAAILWGLAAIGRWDNPLVWVVAQAYPLVLSLLLGAMISQRKLTASGRARWGVLSAALLLVMVLTWQISFFLLAAPAAQYVLLDRREPRRLRFLPWFSTLVPTILCAAAIVAHFHMMGRPPVSGNASLFAAAPRVAEMLAVALANLTFWTAGPVESRDLPWKLASAAAAALLVSLARPAGRRLAAVLAVPAVVLLLLTNLRRAGLDPDAVLSAGRYYYFPTLFWCAAAGVVVDGVARRLQPRARKLAPVVVGLAVLALYAHRQHLIASEAARQLKNLWGEKVAQFDDALLTLHRLAQRSPSDGPTVLPDVPAAIPSVLRDYYPLSSLHAAVAGRPGRILFRRIDELSSEQLVEARRAFREAGTPTGLDWSRATDAFARDVDAVRWLDRRARDAGRIVVVPPVRVRYGAAEPLLVECVRDGMAHPPTNLTFAIQGGDAESVKNLLDSADGPQAALWRAWLDEWAADAVRGGPDRGSW